MDNNKKMYFSRGVTVMEMVVSLSIFMFVFGVTVAIFISSSQQQRRILEEQELINQSSYAVEYMTRAIRIAVVDDTGSCLGSDRIGYYYILTNFNLSTGFYNGIRFLKDDGVCQDFFLNAAGVLKEMKNANASNAQNILSDKFKIKYARFVLNGNKTMGAISKNDQMQPRITISFDVQTKSGATQQERIVQTTVTQFQKSLNVGSLKRGGVIQ